jgi:hypothetical protein
MTPESSLAEMGCQIDFLVQKRLSFYKDYERGEGVMSLEKMPSKCPLKAFDV